MITLTDLSKSYGSDTLFERVNIALSPGRRYGLTGPNGAGKSTLMRILSADEEQDSGTISLPQRIGILRQDQYAFDAFTVMDSVLQGNAKLWAVNQEKEMIYAKGEAITDADGERLAELEMVVAEEDGYMAEVAAGQLLGGLGIGEDLHYAMMSDLPSSLKVRVLLAQALFGNPGALLLDEPTNHLDLDSIEWLETFLLKYDGILVVISHDRHFLNAVCTDTADIDYETIILYPGAYDDMVEAKMAVRARAESENSVREAKIANLQEFIQRFRAGSRASQVKSREKQVERLSPNELRKSNIQRPYIRFEFENHTGKDVIRVEEASLAFAKKGPHEPAVTVCRNWTAHFGRQERVAIIGSSGSGKSALLHMLASQLAPNSGTVTPGHNVNPGFYAQDNFGVIEPGHDLLNWLHDKRPNESQQQVRGFLGRMLFSADDAFKKTDHLSGGERARLLFSELMLMQHNTLFFDEPTNHLDLEAILALGQGLGAYKGTCFVVTHDHALIDAFATRILALSPDGLIDHTGSYDEFHAAHGQLRGGGKRGAKKRR
jgi:ATPase subunit of ABC transporter with duplicated ATPase domains